MPNFAFVLIISGLLVLYGEFIWVGKVIFGVIGSVIALIGVAMLWHLPHSTSGLYLIAASAVCFALEARFETRWSVGILATVFFASGFWYLLPSQPVKPGLLFSLSGVFGLITTFVLSIARRARRNKLSF